MSNVTQIDPKTHQRFLTYRERHTYFGRAELKVPLTMIEFATLDAEYVVLIARPRSTLGKEGSERLAELMRLMLLD
ncbi:MAG: hypothetical protein ACHREM_30645 [Polyangiales bacterium]